MRPHKLNVDYHPHLIGDGTKMHYIENKYGNDGYATWHKILEVLAKTDNHYLDLSEQRQLMFLSARCRVSEDVLKSIISDLAVMGAFDAELWEVSVVWSDKFIDSIQYAYAKRSNSCITKDEVKAIFIAKNRIEPPKESAKQPDAESPQNFKEEAFNIFWDKYKKKIGLENCKKRFLKLSNAEIEKILSVVDDYVLSKPEKQYRKDPLSYLNGKHWNDEIIIKTAAPAPSTHNNNFDTF